MEKTAASTPAEPDGLIARMLRRAREDQREAEQKPDQSSKGTAKGSKTST